ncbi:MAG TPA: hypothetical protein VGB18_00435 [Candidatus Thermoplasmatota archaeon]
MADHVRIIAILNFVWGALTLAGGLQFFFFVDAAPAWIQLAAAFFILLAIPTALAGIGLVQRRRWGRTFAYITGGLSLVSIPIGTAFGIYTFVALKTPEVDATLH